MSNNERQKMNFFTALPLIKKRYGNIIKRKDLHHFCHTENDVIIPARLGYFRARDSHGEVIPAHFDLARFEADHAMGYTGQNFPQQTPEFEQEMEEVKETREEIEARIQTKFDTLDAMIEAIVSGDFRGMIVAGQPGIGKTFTASRILQRAAEDGIIILETATGYVRATGLFRLLYRNRFKNCVLVLDDADMALTDQIALGLLKGALESGKRHTISWNSEKIFESEDGEIIPKSFDFEGSIIFVSNIDFDKEVASKSKLAPHLAAIISRAFYLDLNMKTQEELMIRVLSVIRDTDILKGALTPAQVKVIESYLEENENKLKEISLRTALKCRDLIRVAKGNATMFKMLADNSLLRGSR